MKQKMKFGAITAVVIVGLMVASAFSSMAARTTTPTPSISEQQLIDTIVKGQASGLQFSRMDLPAVDRSSPIYQATSQKLTNHAELSLDGQSVAGAGSGSEDQTDVVVNGQREDEISYATHPGIADDSEGNFILSHRIVNDTYTGGVNGRDPVSPIYGVKNYGESEEDWSDAYIPKYVPGYYGAGTPIRWDNMTWAYWGENDGQKQWFGFVSERDIPTTTLIDESGKFSILRIKGNDPSQINNGQMFRFRPWFGFAAGIGTGTFKGNTKTSIACSEGLTFPLNNTHWVFWPNGTHRPYNGVTQVGGGGEPFGLVAFAVSKDTSSPRTPMEPHITVPCEIFALPVQVPPPVPGVNAYAVTYSWTPIPGNVSVTSCAIDDVDKWGYFAFDPKDGTEARSGMFGYIDDMYKVMYGWGTGNLESHPELDFTVFTWSMTDPNLGIEKPSIAANDGAVVIANELNNRSDPTDNYLMLWYNNLYNGSTWGDGTNGLVTSGLWYSTTGAYFRSPHVQHYEGNTFYVTMIIDNAGEYEIGLAVTYDGGATWGPDATMTIWTISGTQSVPILGDYSVATSDNLIVWENEVDEEHVRIIYDYITGIITGRVTDFLEQGVPDATVDVYNKDRPDESGYAMRLAPVTTDAQGYFKKKCLFGIELWSSNMSIIASDNEASSVGILEQIRWNPAGYVNDAGNIQIDIHYRDLTNFPFYWAFQFNEVSGEYEYTDTGAATAQMMLNYIWAENHFTDQFALFDAFNTGGGTYINGDEMWQGLNANKPSPISEYGYFFNPHANASRAVILQSICMWIDYDMSFYNPAWPAPGHPDHVPVAVPFGGSYENWVAVRGLHTDRDAWQAYPSFPPVTIYGFWIDDPTYVIDGGYYGVPGKTYMTIDTFNTKFLPVNQPGDVYNGKYLAVIEPPEDVNLDDITGSVVCGKTLSELTPAQAKLAAKGVVSDKTMFAAAKNAVMKVLVNGFDNDLAQEFSGSIGTQVIKTKTGYQVTFRGSLNVDVFMSQSGALQYFTLV